MRLLSTFLVFCIFMITNEAFSQVPRGPRYNPPGPGRPYPGPRYPVPVPGPRYPRPTPAPIPRPMPVPRYPVPRYPVPVPVPMPVPRPAPTLSCYYADLYQQDWLVHRFVLNSDCQQAIRDIYETGRFCDDASMYTRHGELLTRYQWEVDCRRALRNYPY